MTHGAQVGDTILLTIKGEVYKSLGGWLMVDGTLLKGSNRTATILSRAIPPLPEEPGTFWLDEDEQIWRVNQDGYMQLPGQPHARAENYAPFRQLVLKQ